MKVIFNFNLQAWLKGVVVEADSEADAEAKLMKMSLEDMLEYGFVKDSDISDIESEIEEYSFDAEVTNIEYDISEDDLEGTGMTMEELLADLPTHCEVTCDDCTSEDDEESLISDMITDKTNFLVNSFEYKVLKRF